MPRMCNSEIGMQAISKQIFGFLLLVFAVAMGSAQELKLEAPRPQITKPISAKALVTLHGNTHPLARPEFDRGAARADLPMERMLLVLKRTPEQEAALREMLDGQQTPGAAGFHKWMTPDEFGNQFGANGQDIATVNDWLEANGFSVDRVGAGKQFIEFSGSAAQVAQAFHTEIHRYAVNGEQHYAKASDPQIPAALAPVVAGIASLNDFRSKPTSQVTKTQLPLPRKGAKPQLLGNGPNGLYHAIAPGDFWRIYNEMPALSQTPAIDGTGQTIAVVARTNIDPVDFSDFRQQFVAPDGFSGNPLHVILDGPDPGIVSEEQEEATLDMEWSSAAAPNAQIDLVVSAGTHSTEGVLLSQIYVIDNNLAPVMSASFGSCEMFQGNAGNRLNNALAEQAAAQGITSVVSTGDSGAAGCDPAEPTGDPNNPDVAHDGLAVNGLASTPYDVAVGGTQLNDLANQDAYWDNSVIRDDLSSARGYIPEQVWDQTCSVLSCGQAGATVSAGSGGASSCVTRQEDASGNPVLGPNKLPVCQGGYAKPSWQAGVNGIPNDGVRDLPDVSLTASGAHDAYVICLQENCSKNSFSLIGGPSAAAPAFAGVMALVNQKMGARQGQANYVLYQLAKAQQAQLGSACVSSSQPVPGSSQGNACVFYDITTGNNGVPCAIGSPDCTATVPGSSFGTLAGYSAGPGYDQATGLGTINVANLLSKWHQVSFQGTATTLAAIQPATLTHGQGAAINVQVKPMSGSGAPTGNVSIVTNNTIPGSKSVAVETLQGGSVSASLNSLPGGSYQVQAQYGGDGTYGSSTSSPVSVTVNPEASATKLLLTTDDAHGNAAPVSSPVAYGTDITAQISPGSQAQPAGDGTATGNITMVVDGQPAKQTYTLNSAGSLQLYYAGSFTFAVGQHTLAASYGGDASYQPSTSPASSITVTQASVLPVLTADQTAIAAGQTVNFVAVPAPNGDGSLPTGSVTFYSGAAAVGSAVPLVQGTDKNTGNVYAVAQATFTAAQLPGGADSITAQYAGDGNYAATTSQAVSLNNTTGTPNFMLAPGTAAPITAGATATSTVTLTPGGGFTGAVALTCSVANPGNVSPAAADEPACTLNPATANVTGAAAVTTTLSVATKARPAATGALAPHTNGNERLWWIASGGSSLACVLLLGVPARRRRSFMLMLGAFAILTAGMGCGGGGSASNGGGGGGTTGGGGGTGGGGSTDPGTPPGAYVVTVKAVSGQITQQSAVTINVQ